MRPPPTVSWRSIKEHDSVFILLHDQGEGPHSLSLSLQKAQDSRGQTLYNLYPSLKLVCPSAPIKGSTSQWFDPNNDGLNGLDESILRVQQLLKQEADRLQGRWDRIILAGVGQGATVAVCAFLTLVIPVRADPGREGGHGKLGALMAFSSDIYFSNQSLAVRQSFPPENMVEHAGHLERTPTMLIYQLGQDQAISEKGRKMRDMLEEVNVAVAYKEYAANEDWPLSSSCFDDILTCIRRLV